MPHAAFGALHESGIGTNSGAELGDGAVLLGIKRDRRVGIAAHGGIAGDAVGNVGVAE